MLFRKILRIIAIVGIPLILLLQAVSFVFIIMHWEGARVLSTAAAPFLFITMLAGFLYAVLVKPQPKFQKPTFDFDNAESKSH